MARIVTRNSRELRRIMWCPTPEKTRSSFGRCLSKVADDTKLGGRQKPLSSAVKVLYDGECRLCKHEISFLKKMAAQRPVHFVDINTAAFTPDKFEGVTYEMAMREMHVIGADGKVHVQSNAIREMYRASGLGWLASLTQLPGVERVFDELYLRFAHHRLQAALHRCDTGDTCSVKLKHLSDKLRQQQG